MPVFIDQPDAFELLAKVEGERWATRQRAGQFGEWGFPDILAKWLASAHDRSVNPEGAFPGVIYGDDGWNRYTVRRSGEILFIRAQAWGEEAIVRATAAGFRLFG